MKAFVQRRCGPPDVLAFEEIEPPTPAEGEVLVRVRAASVNPVDWHTVRGRPFAVRLVGNGLRRPGRAIPGSDVAGIVQSVGPGVTAVSVGDAVFGWSRGSFAEVALASADRLVQKPAALTFEEAAAVPIAAVTALQGLRDAGRLEAGQRVLVIGASGGVGTFAVQIAKVLGAEVTGVCSVRNLELVRSLGVDQVIDYEATDVAEAGRRYDVVFQLAGTRSPLALRHVLRRRGTLVLSSGEGRFSGLDRIALARAASLLVSQRLVTFFARPNGRDLTTVTELIESGGICPVIDRVYPFAQAREALRHVETGHARGKVVIRV